MLMAPKVSIKTMKRNTIYNNIVFSKLNITNNYIETSIPLSVFKTRDKNFAIIQDIYIYISILILYLQKMFQRKLRISHFVQPRPGLSQLSNISCMITHSRSYISIILADPLFNSFHIQNFFFLEKPNQLSPPSPSTRKRTFPTASRATVENCLLRSELVAKVASKIFLQDLDILLKQIHAHCQDNLLRSDVDVVVSENITTQRARCQSLHK